MRILFVMRHAGFVRNFDTALRLMAERGHRIHLAFQMASDAADTADRLCADYESVTQGWAPARDDAWTVLASLVRTGIDYLRFLEPRYRVAGKARRRVQDGAPRSLVRAAAWPPLATPRGRRVLRDLLRWIDQGIPAGARIDEFMREQHPDILLITPLLAGPTQADFVRSARTLGIRTALPVTSWDNLTNKGLIRDAPDSVFLWNEAQRREAIEDHGIPAERVRATGAHTYDHWFAWAPSTSREQFSARVGLDPGRPFLLYLCSSKFIAPNEREFVEKWVAEVRTHGAPALREAGILVRPHPASGVVQWGERDLGELENVAVWPPVGADPRHPQAKADYFDSMYHSAATVGVNTSALIESAIVGRRAYTVLAPEFRETQEGTLHFQHLLEANGGPLTVAETFEQHLADLATAVDPSVHDPEWNRPFLASFVRPHGLEEPAAPMLVRAIEEAASEPAPAPVAPLVLAPVLLRPVSHLAGWHEAGGRRALRSARKRGRRARRQARIRAGAVARRVVGRGGV